MPLDHPDLLGTEKDGSKSTIYCLYCYRDGEFSRPEMTIEEMQTHVREQLEQTHATKATIEKAQRRLPHLLRWQGVPAIHHCADWH